MSVKPVGMAQGRHPFKIYVFPSDCRVTKITFTVFKDKAKPGMTQAEIDKNSCAWEGTTREITKPTILDLTFPASAASYDITVYTTNAIQKTLARPSNFQTAACRIYEIKSMWGIYRSEVLWEEDLDLTKDKLAQYTAKQTVLLTPASSS